MLGDVDKLRDVTVALGAVSTCYTLRHTVQNDECTHHDNEYVYAPVICF